MTTYTIKPGDTLGKIAQKFLGSSGRYMEIANSNGITNPNKIAVGQELVIPGHSPEAAPVPVVVDTGTHLLTQEQFKQIVPSITNANLNRYLGAINKMLSQYDVASPIRLAHFLVQTAHETGGFRRDSENLNYRADRLRVVFPKYFKTDAEAAMYAGQPERIASKIYADRMGNGNEASGEGWQYRGRGIVQLTGKEN